MDKNLKDFEELSQEARIAEFEDNLNELEAKTNKKYPNKKPKKTMNKTDKILTARLIIEFVSFLITFVMLLVILLKY